MGFFYSQPLPAVEDLMVKFQETILVSPIEKTERKSIFLSNLDQMHNYYVPTAHFFSPNPDFPPNIVVKRLKMALEKVLVQYDFVAGRLKTNEESGRRRLEIDCNAAGVGFVVASSEYSLRDFGDEIVFSNPAFRKLAVYNFWPHDDHPLCIFQVTSFKCGGFAIGMVTNHILFDGTGAQTFLANLASQAFDDDNKPLHVIPCNNRRLLAARSLPLVSFPHPEFSMPAADRKPDGESETRIFKLSPSDVNYLKKKASKDFPSAASASASAAMFKITTYSVVAALVWRCKALSSSNDMDKERVSTFLTSMDIRRRLNNPPLPLSYCGNALLYSKASAKVGDIEELPFSELVQLVAQGMERFSDEYARSVIDLLEIEKGKLRPRIEYNVSSWLRLGFDQVVYPWGKPLCIGPLLTVVRACLLFPSADGGVNAFVSLPDQEMQKFQASFYGFFRSTY
ncbi:hypothetical protein ABFS83_07G072800 [Erythranthe nasuta]